MAKYIITDIKEIINGVTLYKIKNLVTNKYGGWIENEGNLSQEGNCFIYDNAMVFGSAHVSGNATVSDSAEVYGSAIVSGNAKIYGNAVVCDNARVKDNAQVYGHAIIDGDTTVSGNEHVFERSYRWKDIASLTSLKIFIAGGDKSEKIYANGKHQVPIDIYLEARDKNNAVIEIESREIFKNIQFVDYKNTLFDQKFHFSENPGEYIFPIRNRIDRSHGSSTTAYISIDNIVNSFKLCVRCSVNGQQYTTSIESNNGNAIPDYVSLDVLPERRFSDSNIETVTSIEEKPDGYNSTLKKYYVHFRNTDGTLTKSATCQESNWFHYKQTGNYKGCSTSTDTSVDVNTDATFTRRFDFTENLGMTITSKNHEFEGLCFWSYRLWSGILWSYNEWGGEMNFILRDQYGNEANMVARSDGDEQLTFIIRH